MPKTMDYLGDSGDNASSRLPSTELWFDCPWAEIGNTVAGVKFFDDFTAFPKTPPNAEGNWGQYAMFSDTGGTATAGAGQGGELVIGSDGDNEGCSLRTVSTPFLISRSTKQFWFEARVKSSTVTNTKHGFFCGFMQDVALTNVLPIKADGTLADTNFVGFHRLEADGVHLDTVYKTDGNAQVNVQTDAVTISADTYVKIGMRYEGGVAPYYGYLGQYVLSFWSNNAKTTTNYTVVASAGTDFPNDIALGLVFAVQNATAVTPGTSTIDWWRAAQLI